MDNCVESVLKDNPEYSESRAYAICWAQKNKGNLSLPDDPSHKQLLEAVEKHFDDPCWEGYTMVGMKPDPNGSGMVPNCVPDDDVPDANLSKGGCPEGQERVAGFCVTKADTPPSSLDMSKPRVLASASPLDTQPIEREELENDKVAYRGLKLIDSGVWTDQNSQTPTLYDDRTFENTVPEYPDKYNGPPVNISHDIHKDGPKEGQPHEASVGGFIEPDSIRTGGEALFGDVILNTDDPAGAFADENLKSALENNGTAGFSPSVELMPTDMGEADHPRAEEYVEAAELEGLGLVRDPASESVDLAYEARTRGVALASGQTDKGLVVQRQLMSPEELREILDNYGFENLDEMSDEDVMEVAEDLHEDLMGELMPEEGKGEEAEMAEHGDYEDGEEEDDEEEQEMQEGAIDSLEEQIDDLWDAMDELKEEMASQEEMSAELEEAREELAAAESVQELKEAADELDKRLSNVENEEKDAKTLAEGPGEENGFDWSDGHEEDVTFDGATGTTY